MHFLTLRDLQSNFKPPSIPIPPLEGEARRGPSSCLVIIPCRIRRSMAGDMLRHVTKRQGFGTHRLDIVGSILSSVCVQILLLSRGSTYLAIDNLTHLYVSFCVVPPSSGVVASPRKTTPLFWRSYAVVGPFVRRCFFTVQR